MRKQGKTMDTWRLTKSGYDPSGYAKDGNRFLCANGYMGVRGTVEEAGKEQFPAITLAGVYDQYQDKWREPVNAPDCLFAKLFMNGRALTLNASNGIRHSVSLDYRHGLYQRDTDFEAVLLSTQRFASMARCHLLADRLQIEVQEDGDLEIQTGISCDLWDINGPHLFDPAFEQGKAITCRALTGEKGILVAAAQCVNADFGCEERFVQTGEGLSRVLQCKVKKGDRLTLDIFGAVYTSLDGENPVRSAADECLQAAERGYDACLTAHCEAWESIWKRSEVQMEGSAAAQQAIHASQYHLNCVAPRHADNMSIPARGLSGQTYKGAIFWDSEMFFFPMFVYTQPEVAKSLLRYRIETLGGALVKAKEYGYRGAYYAWESQEGGAEGCTNFNVVDVFTHRPVRTYFRDKQIHISGDIAYALRRYYEITGDRTLLEEGGAEVILECARFYLSRANCRLDTDAIDYADVIGPDEYHERVTNNAFTNQMIRDCMETALKLKDVFDYRPEHFDALLKRMQYEEDWRLLEQTCKRIRKPLRKNGVIEQFDGYFDLEDCSLATVRSRLVDPREYWGGDHGVAGTTQIIKQADVIAMMALFPECFSDAEVAANWDYYEPRTEHGSSLSACMYALTACRTGRLNEAWDLFMRTAAIDIEGGGKEWAGEIYIGGTHPASNGGAWMIAALGFAGLRVQNGKLELHPQLPPQITRLTIPITFRGQQYLIEVDPAGAKIRTV